MSFKRADEGQLEAQMMYQKAAINDVVQKYKHQIGNNEREMNKRVKVLDNKLIDRWEHELLRPLGEGGMIQIKKATDSWEIWYDGYQNRNSHPMNHMFLVPTKEQIAFWTEKFDGSIDELHALGRLAVMQGMQVLSAAFMVWLTDTKYEEIFTGDDPEVWYKLFIEKNSLFRPLDHPDFRKSPFDLHKYREKASAILSIDINPIA